MIELIWHICDGSINFAQLPDAGIDRTQFMGRLS
jgi:hypothetical protein